MKTVFVNMMNDSKDCKTVKEKLAACYTNTGNLVWHDCCKKEIDYEEEVALNDLSKDYENTVLVVPVANNLSVGETEFSKKLRTLLNVNAQIALIGLGAQSGGGVNTPLKLVRALSNGKKRLFQQIADKSISIGCRGYYTAECLDRMGIHNYHVIGCPSAYSTSLNGVIEKMPVPQLRKIVFNMTGGSRGNDRILDLVMKSGVDSRLIMQGMRDMPDTFDHRGVGKAVKEYWKSKAEIFYRLEEWEDYLKYEKFTFSFGTRLHGNMLSFLEGVPTLWITHDDRTQEIIDVFKFPHLNIDRFERRIKRMRYLEQVMEYCIYDEVFYKNFYRMRKTYISFLNENEIHHKLQYVE